MKHVNPLSNSAYAPHQLLTPAEVAKTFRVDAKTVTRWARAGKLSTVRTPGGHRRFLAAEVEELARIHIEPEERQKTSS